MRVKVSEGQCQGHARCLALVPEMFDLDDEGYAFVLPGQEEIDEDDTRSYEQALLAVDNCPEQAIVIEYDPGPDTP
jgi:ferredoxin